MAHVGVADEITTEFTPAAPVPTSMSMLCIVMATAQAADLVNCLVVSADLSDARVIC
jgi:hypothetical protein